MVITPAIRFKARDIAGLFPMDSNIHKAYNHASYAESFPNSYTVNAVTVSEQYLAALASNEDIGLITYLSDYINQMVTLGVWYKGSLKY